MKISINLSIESLNSDESILKIIQALDEMNVPYKLDNMEVDSAAHKYECPNCGSLTCNRYCNPKKV